MPNTPKVVDREALKEFRKRNDQRYVLEGEYSPNTRVGESDVAENLAPYSEQSGASDATPFVFQSSGGSSDIGSLAYLKALRGNTVVWNQIINDNFDNTGYWGKNRLTMTVNSHIAHFVANSNAYNSVSFYKYFVAGTLIKNHKYLMVVKTKVNSGNLKRITLGSQGLHLLASITNPELNKWYELSSIFTQPRENDQSTNGFNVAYEYNSVDDIVVDSDNFDAKEPQLFDLTQMFGAGNEPTTVEEFNRLFPKPYYAYNAGELLSCKVNGYKTVGYNQFSGDFTHGGIGGTGVPTSGGSNLRTTNLIKVIPGRQYTFEYDYTDSNAIFSQVLSHAVKFYTKNEMTSESYLSQSVGSMSATTKGKGQINVTIPSNCHYVAVHCFYLTNASDVSGQKWCFHLTWDGTRTGYKPYETKTYPMPNVELKSAGSAYDELKPDGTLIRRIGVVDLGTLVWSRNTSYTNPFFATSIVSGLKANGKCLSAKYKTIANTSSYWFGTNANNLEITIASSEAVILIRDDSYSDAATFKSAMSGVILYYELATPTEETVTGYQEITPIDDWGTQEFLYDSDIDIPVPQGNEFFYPVDYKAFIDSVGGREDIEYDSSKIVSLTQLNNFLKTIAGYDATKTQSLKNVSGTIQWVDEE